MPRVLRSASLESFTDVTDQVEKALKKSKTQEDKAKALGQAAGTSSARRPAATDKFIVWDKLTPPSTAA